MVAVRHAKVATGPNNGAKQVSTTAWNDNHEITGTAGTVLAFDSDGNAVELPQVSLEQMGGGTAVADNAAAFALATASPVEVRLGAGTYSFSSLVIPADINVRGAGRGATTILITGDGGGAPSAGANGGVQMFANQAGLSDLTLAYNNASLQCLLNISHASATGRINVERVDMEPRSLSVTQINAVAIYLQNLTSTAIRDMQIGLFPNFKQCIQVRGFWNGCSLQRITFRPHAKDIANAVYHQQNYQLDINASTWGSSIDDCIFENGPNGARVTGQGTVSFKGNYWGDGYTSLGFWIPGLTVAQGDLIYPSASTTGSIDIGVSTTTLTVASATGLYKYQKIVVIGAGAAGANLTTRITAIAGTTVTIDTAASTTVAAVGVYRGAYAGHGYVCTAAGTTGSSAPAFPTTAGGTDTVTDNTVTWRQYGPCAWIDGSTAGGLTGKNSITTIGDYFGEGICSIVSRRTGASPGTVNIIGGAFVRPDYAGQFDGVDAVIIGPQLNAYKNLGFEFLGAGGGCRNNFITSFHKQNITNGADVVVSTNSSNMGGLYCGDANLTGVGASKFFLAFTGGSIGAFLSVPGTITSNAPAGGVGYSTGAGGTVTQTTNKATGVTLNRPTGRITMNNAELAADTPVSFTLTNSVIASTDLLVLNHVSGGTVGAYTLTPQAGSGSATITVRNVTAGPLSEAIVIGFAVVKAATA